MSNSSVNIKFRWGVTPSDPEQNPVLIVGQAVHLNALSWDELRCKLEPKVSLEAWKRGVWCATSAPGEPVEVWPRGASVCALPARAERHAAPSRAHALAKIVRAQQPKGIDHLVILTTLNFLATGSYQKPVGRDWMAPVSQQTASSCIGEVVEALVALLPQFIKFPMTNQERDKVKHGFFEKFRMPGVLGCLDGTLVAILAPREHPSEAAFFSRKGYHAINAAILVCRKRDVVPSATAIARSVPLYSARSSTPPLPPAPPAPAAPPPKPLHVQIILAPEDKQGGEPENDILGPLDPVLSDMTLSAEELTTIQDIADATRLAARITDTPCNIMNVDTFIEEAVAVASELDISPPTIIRGEELKARGMGGIYGVGKAAAVPPALVTLSYTAPGATETVAWVGKGIVYDTGGLSIKGRTSMVGMKGDCGGAAAVLGAFAAAVKATPTVNLHAVLCLAENAVGPLSTRPDDIHTLYSGRTVEINNTDAEGRLVLSDGVVYASRDLKANTIVDIATLTGAQGTATGKYHAAIVSNSGRLESLAVASGLRSADLTHPLPFAPELHFSEFSSCVADMKNSVADRSNAQPSCAGLFILAHLGFDFPGNWLHIDMAAPAHCGERATGYGVALLTVLFGAHTRSKLLRALCPAPPVN